LHDRIQKRRPSKTPTNEPQSLPSPSPKIKLINVFDNFSILNRKPRRDMIGHRSPGFGEFILRNPIDMNVMTMLLIFTPLSASISKNFLRFLADQADDIIMYSRWKRLLEVLKINRANLRLKTSDHF
jgi:hypothetical protein